MKNTKFLALAAVTALSLGFGSAMAQNAAATAPAYSAGQRTTTAPYANRATTQESTVQYGSSDHGFAPLSNLDSDKVGGGF